MCPTRADRDAPRALALLSPADVDFIHGLKSTAAREIAKGQELGGLLQAVSHHLDCFEEEVTRAEARDGDGQPAPALLLSDPWGPVTAKRDVPHANAVTINGPGADNRFEVVGSSPDEASRIVKYVTGVDAACRRMKEIRSRCLQLFQKQQQLHEEQKRLKQPAATTVDDHIRLLRQYNKMKDVGQQLIGLIAENRGVPVGSLYVNQDYGVGADD